MTIAELLSTLQTRLLPVAGEFALPEAERSLAFLLDCSRSQLYIDKGKTEPSTVLVETMDNLVDRRLAGEPLAYILGSVFFYHREFIVAPPVLIPRPDTEILVQEVLDRETADARFFIDIGTGSGCIAATLVEHRPCWRGLAVDRSFNALTIANRNCGNRVALACADLVSSVKERRLADFIVSNPPYIPTKDLAGLSFSVRGFEPRLALDGGSDGLDFYRNLAQRTPPLLKSCGRIYCEIGYDQGKSVPAIFASAGWTDITVIRDFGGHHRVVRATRPEKNVTTESTENTERAGSTYE